jgi:CheY-like chemotaxis protein
LARKILLADDSVTAQNMGRKILTDAGYEVITVNNGSAALKKILDAKPDLVVLDVYMPGYSGLEVCQRIKENREASRIPILLTVGKLEPFKPEEARRVRADAFVVKPFEASELLAALARLEDKIVPQPEPHKQGRFARAVAAVDELESTERDESWKARLRIPIPGHQETETQPGAETATASGSHEFKSGDSGKKAKTPHREGVFEPPLPSGLPGDITPEEIAALTAAAAQLRGSGSHPGLPDLRASTPVAPMPAEIARAVTDHENSSPVTFASAPELPAPSDGVSLAQAGAESAKADAAEPASADVSNGAAVATDPVPNVAATETKLAEGPEGKTTEVAAPDVPKIDAPIAHTTQPEMAQAEPTTADARAVAPPDSNVSQTVAPAASAEPAAQAADDEVMAALQSLMPVDCNSATPATKPAYPEGNAIPGIAAMIAQVDSAEVKAHAAGPRWIAEEVALSEDEASLSLEREMEQAYAAAAVRGGVRAASAVSVAEAARHVSAEISTAEFEGGIAPPPEPQPAESAAAYAMAASASEAGAIHCSHAVAMPHIEPEGIEAGAAGTSEPASQASQPAVEEPSFTPSVDSLHSPDIEISGGVEDMAASWKNIRDSIATGGAAKAAPAKEKDEVRAADAGEAQESATTAPEPGTHSSASDPKSIASIVDSVLAELRPKIVEEIAKKLADSKKE